MTSERNPTRFTKVVVAIGVFVLVFAVARSIYFPHTREGKRRARVEAARLHAVNVVGPLLAKQKRFEAIQATEWWKDDGYFWVRGFVDSEADLRDLKQLIIATYPPAPIAWDVEVETNTATNGLSR
jgi:hypothetical protein